MQAATNANRYLNIRFIGSYFQYTDSSIHLRGLDMDATANFATAGAALDVFPWPAHGFRVSPGLFFYNQNGADAVITTRPGAGFTLNHVTFFSSQTDPVRGVGSLSFHRLNPAFSLSIGWGNMIPRNGRHWSFPFEIGAALIGTPQPTITFTGGQVCANTQGTISCHDVQSDPVVAANLQIQLSKYHSNLHPLEFYPVISFGVAYSFRLR